MTAAAGLVVRAAGAGAGSRIGGDRFLLKDPVVDDDGRFAVIEYFAVPGVPGPPAHRHVKFEEAWFILEGSVEFWDGKTKSIVGPGAYLRVPPGVPHTFRVVGDDTARWVGIFSPGRYVHLLEELGQIIPPMGPPDPKQIAALFEKYDTELVPGPP